MSDTAQIKAAFCKADVNGDGLITAEELKKVFQEVGSWAEEDVDALLAAADKNGDDRLNYDEFIDWIMESGIDSTAAASAGIQFALSWLVVKKWDDDQWWAGQLGSSMFKLFGYDGRRCQVARFWAIIREKRVDLYRMTHVFNADNLHYDADAEVLKFRLGTWPIETGDDYELFSARLLEIFKEIYDMIVACGAATHGLVYVGHGNGDGSLFEVLMSQTDSQKLLEYANQKLGRRIDFLEFSGNCNQASLSNLAVCGPYCRYMVASEFTIGGFDRDDVGEDGLLTPVTERRSTLAAPEYTYPLMDLSGKSVLAALITRVSYAEDWWEHTQRSRVEKKGYSSMSIYCTEAWQEFLDTGGKALAEDENRAARLAESRVNLGDFGYIGNVYDVGKLMGEELKGLFDRVRIYYRHKSHDGSWPELHGMYARSCAVLKWVEGYDGLDHDARMANWEHDPPIEFYSSEWWDTGIPAGLKMEEVFPFGDEPHFPEASPFEETPPREFGIDSNVYWNYFNIKGDVTNCGMMDACVVAKVSGNDQNFKVQYCQYFPEEDSTYIQLDEDHNAAEGDTLTLVSGTHSPLPVLEVGEEVTALRGW